MSEDYVLVVNGLNSLADIEKLQPKLLAAARRAINTTLDRTRTDSAERIRKQVNYPASYLSPSQGRLKVTKRASGSSLEGAIVGQGRPTSLARFATNSDPAASRRANGTTVSVKPTGATFMKGAFLIRLRSGSQGTETQSNLGLAIRLKVGESIRNKTNMTKMSKGLYLLYGPAVAQVFSDVAEDEVHIAADFLEGEYLRLLDL